MTSKTEALEQEIIALRAEQKELAKKLNTYRKQGSIFQALAKEVAKVVTPLPALPSMLPIKKHKNVIQEDLVLHLSDEHMDEIVDPTGVQNFEEYNFAIAMRRAEVLVEKTLKFTQETLANYKFRDLWVLAYGDHTSGELHNSVDRSAYKNQFRNCFAISQIHAQMLRDLASYFKKVHVVYIAGNHHRRTPKKDYHGAWDGWDYMIGESARQQCKLLKNVEFTIPNAFSIVCNINGYNFAIEHGDDIKSWNSIPYYGLERKNRRLIALNAIKGIQIHYSAYGHFHRPGMMSEVGDNEQIVNGTWKGTDAYIFGSHSSYIEPSQWIHGVHHEHGISWRLKVKLRSDDESQGPKRYSVSLATP